MCRPTECLIICDENLLFSCRVSFNKYTVMIEDDGVCINKHGDIGDLI